MKPIKLFVVSLSVLSFLFTTNNALAQQRNVKSSCRLHTTAGIIGKGRCTIKTYMEGDYIMVVVYKSWDKRPDRLRLTNNPKCTRWIPFPSEENIVTCLVEMKLEEEPDWGVGFAGEYETNGKKEFVYGVGGSGYAFYYNGPLPRP
ncbi:MULTISPECIES: hypothetical protein [unclassified Anabaena]|uniref:hypothetical protein n=1 Tax=unclassified Anabaena TaxID=2619674 RepID=UPI0006ABF95D|nr:MULTISPECIES: hypothetical protein [unclassified Anabaena]ALB39886.1 hypothetical protein AA650_04890 [Anabaena sp. WA102]OBQ17626.1 MAG: hypothetical protein AN486_14495 [Anabaena sp. AL93]